MAGPNFELLRIVARAAGLNSLLSFSDSASDNSLADNETIEATQSVGTEAENQQKESKGKPKRTKQREHNNNDQLKKTATFSRHNY
jgi:hypothetical protein